MPGTDVEARDEATRRGSGEAEDEASWGARL